MIPAPNGRYPQSEHYRLSNEDQLITNIPHPHPPDGQDHAITDKGLPSPQRMTTLVVEVAGAFRELR
jgi:hypothetical protein